MGDDLYFDGDPATDSARRHLERVLKEPDRPRRWPWVVGTAMAVATWYFWPKARAARTDKAPGGDSRDQA